jgi:1-deoxy-D-xylulose-5-phosphate reductoisomerase
MSVRHLTILGSTGSIGVSTLDVVRRHPDRFRVMALCAHRQVERLVEQCLEFRPRFAVVGDEALAALAHSQLAGRVPDLQVLHGPAMLERMAALPEVDTVMAAIVGAAGLAPTLSAAQAGKRILLANKEALVMAGPVFMRAVRENGASLLPIDSEHNAIFQSLPDCFESDLETSLPARGVRRLILTASGGPFRTLPLEALADVTPAQAVAHPNWVMGRKISVDSATMMNKGLEVIEARWLFDMPVDRIDVVIHPQSVIHSMVDYADGSVIAQLGNPDMRTPIAHAMAYPERIESGVPSLDLFRIGRLDFEAPDLDRFPCLALAFDALRTGESAPATLNAANEIAVDAFLSGKLGFTEIPQVIAATLEACAPIALARLADVMAADAAARRFAAAYIDEYLGS